MDLFTFLTLESAAESFKFKCFSVLHFVGSCQRHQDVNRHILSTGYTQENIHSVPSYNSAMQSPGNKLFSQLICGKQDLKEREATIVLILKCFLARRLMR